MKTVFAAVCGLLLSCAAFGQTIVQLEYFVDTDAGFGKNKAVPVTPAADGTLPFNVDLTGASVGFHALYIRTRDSNGQWSHTTRRTVEVLKNTGPSNVARVEYFFDTDPGVGKAASVALATPQPDGTFSFVIPASQTTPGAHTLYVRAQDNSSRNWSLTQWKAITIVNCTPPAQAAAIASQTVCAGGTVTYTAAAVAAATGYQWTAPSGWTLTSGQGTATVTLRAPVVTSATTFTALSVAAVNSCDAGPVRLFLATVNALPPRPAIIASGDTALVSSAPSGNQWFLNGAAIPDATGRTHRPTAAGQYTVHTTQSGCVSPASEAYSFVVTAINELVILDVQAFPNPITDHITLVNNTPNPVRAQLYSLTGQQLITTERIRATYQVNTGRLATGCYVLLITDGSRFTRKLIVKE